MSPEADELLSRLRAAMAALPDAPCRTECPPADRIWEAVHGRVEPAELERLVAHSLRCATCGFAFRFARQSLEEPAREAVPIRLRPRWWQLAAAASVAAAALWVGVALRASPRQRTELRSADRDSLRSLTPASVQREAAILRWTPAGPGAHYTVIVSRLDLTLLARVEGLEDTELNVPPAALSTVPAGERILWRVEARLRTGQVVDSESFVIRVE